MSTWMARRIMSTWMARRIMSTRMSRRIMATGLTRRRDNVMSMLLHHSTASAAAARGFVMSRISFTIKSF